MAELAEQLVKVVYPTSTINIDDEVYEFLIGWYNGNGAMSYYLFHDWEVRDTVTTTPININDDTIRTIINNEERIIKLVAEDISRHDLEGFKQLNKAKTVARVFRFDSVNFEPGGLEYLAIKSPPITYMNANQRFNIEIQVQRRELPLYQ